MGNNHNVPVLDPRISKFSKNIKDNEYTLIEEWEIIVNKPHNYLKTATLREPIKYLFKYKKSRYAVLHHGSLVKLSSKYTNIANSDIFELCRIESYCKPISTSYQPVLTTAVF